MAIRIDELADAVSDALKEYSEELMEDVKDSVKSAAKACVRELKATSPELTGSYKKGWRANTAFESGSDIRVQVHNATAPQLTHLLEDGHANVDGGRTSGHPHIGPAAEKASALLEKDINLKVGMK